MFVSFEDIGNIMSMRTKRNMTNVSFPRIAKKQKQINMCRIREDYIKKLAQTFPNVSKQVLDTLLQTFGYDISETMDYILKMEIDDQQFEATQVCYDCMHCMESKQYCLCNSVKVISEQSRPMTNWKEHVVHMSTIHRHANSLICNIFLQFVMLHIKHMAFWYQNMYLKSYTILLVSSGLVGCTFSIMYIDC